MATSGAGSNLVYHYGKKLRAELMHRIADLYIGDTAGSQPQDLTRWLQGQFRVCSKKSATTPGDRAEDYPLHLGDFCIHYNAAGVYQGVYVCTAVTITGGVVAACTWTQLTVS